MAECPLRIADDAEDKGACCRWDTFAPSFSENFARWFDRSPTIKEWQSARRDWRQANTGYEAAHNARSRENDRLARAAEVPLVWLGGKNYAYPGSELAIKHGLATPPTQKE